MKSQYNIKYIAINVVHRVTASGMGDGATRAVLPRGIAFFIINRFSKRFRPHF